MNIFRHRPPWFWSFHVRAAVGFVLAAILGFSPTYWAPLAAGTLAVKPIVHIHGFVFFCWTLLYLVQTILVARGRTRWHRSLGLVGISLATAMSILGPLITLNTLVVAEAAGAARQAEAAIVTPLTSIAAFAILVFLAMSAVDRPEIHKRLMMLSIVAIVDAPLARLAGPLTSIIYASLYGGRPPAWIGLESSCAVADLFLFAGIVNDRRERGKPHPIYLIGGGAIVAMQLLRLPLAETAAWHGIAHAFLRLAG